MSILDGGPPPLAADAPCTLTEALLRAARGERGIRYIDVEGRASSQSYAALLLEARPLSSGLRAAGLRPGDRVIIHAEPLRDCLTAFWACVLTGVVPVVVSVAPSYEGDNGVLRKLRGAHALLGAPPILTSQHLTGPLSTAGARLGMGELRLHTIEALRGHPPAERPHEARGEDLCFLQLTSGSTGAPKCVEERHLGLIYDLGSYAAAQRSAQGDVTLNWFPMDHVLPLVYHHIKSVFVGCDQVHAPTDYVLASPLRWLELAERCGATHTWAPNFALKLLGDALAAAPGRDFDLGRLRCLLTAGEPVSEQVLRGLLARLGPMGFAERTLHTAYGMTECSIAYQGDFSLERCVHELDGRRFIDVGVPHAGVQLRVLREDGAEAPERSIGRVQARRPIIAPRYYPGLPITKEYAEEGWIETGDQGFLDGGRLIVTGRAKEMIIVRGKNLFCQEIEEVAGQIAGVERTFLGACAVEDAATGTEGFCLFFVPEGGHDGPEVARALRIGLTAALGVAPTHVVPLGRAEFPRTTSGKVQRALLRKGLLAGDYAAQIAAAAPPPREVARPETEAEQALAVIWREVLRLDAVGVRDNFFDLGGSSLLLAQVRLKVEERFQRTLPPTALFEHPTIAALARYLTGGVAAAAGPRRAQRSSEDDIAVIGLAGRFPGARDVWELWRNLQGGVESIARLSEAELRRAGVEPAVLRQPSYVRASASLDDIERFDAAFFGYPPREAALLDPQARLLLECAHEALCCAGYAPPRAPGAVGVFASGAMSSYLLQNVAPGLDLSSEALPLSYFQAHIGNDKDFLATRLAYKLDLRGPAVTVQTACSSSLVAIHQARKSLLAGECDMALAGGVAIHLPQRLGYLHLQQYLLSADGHCRAFDARASGTLFGDGAGVVVLRRLRDALEAGDPIFAVIKGSAINNDGAEKIGYTAPSVQGQAAVIAAALDSARVDPATIGYVEAHGTATAQGDPIEIAALTQVYRRATAARGFCAVGSLKTNIGHLDNAAGVAGFIKAVLMLRHGVLVPSLHFERPNPAIDFDGSPFYVGTELRRWEPGAAPRRAAVSAFGVGGTNAHVILEEPPQRPARPAAPPEARPHYLRLSARSDLALREIAWRYAERLAAEDAPELGDLCFTAQDGEPLPRRATLCVRDAEEARAQLQHLAEGEWIPPPVDDEAVARRYAGGGFRRVPLPAYPFERERFWIEGPRRGEAQRPVVFVFSGQGGQWPAMGRELLDTQPAFRAAIEACDRAMAPHIDWSLLAVLRGEGPDAALSRVEVIQPALFAMQVGLSALLREVGVTPRAVIGHSLGEIAAACVAGALRLQDAARIICLRGRLLSQVGRGGMLLVELSEEQALAAIEGREARVSIGASNGPRATVLSGDVAALSEIKGRLDGSGVFNRWVKVDFAAHSPMVEGAAAELRRALSGLRPLRQRAALYSTVLGRRCEAVELCAGYWARNLREPVRLWHTMQQLEEERPLFVEISPHPVLAPSLEAGLRALGREATVLPALRRGEDPEQVLAAFLPEAPQTGARDELCYELRWESTGEPRRTAAPSGRWLIIPERPERPERSERPEREGGERGRLAEAVARAMARRGVACVVAEGGTEAALGRAAALAAEGLGGVLHLGALSVPRGDALGPEALRAALAAACEPALALARQFAERPSPPRLWLVTRGAQGVGGPPAAPAQAPLWGLGRALSLEIPAGFGGLVDLDPAAGASAEDSEVEQLLDLLGDPAAEEQIALRGGRAYHARLVPAELPPATVALRRDRAYLITGGMGRIGLQLARWLAQRGAGHLVLLGRSARPAAQAIGELEALGATVEIVQADVADRERLAEVLGRPRPPLAGVLHAAGVLTMTPLAALDAAALQDVSRAKVLGAAALHELLRGAPLDFFVLFSSAAAVWGGRGQAHYAAANQFLDALAESRRAAALPATSIAWGWWESAEEAQETAELFLRSGLVPMAPERAIDALERAIASGCATRTVAAVDWSVFRPLYEAQGRRRLLEGLSAASPGPVAAPEPAQRSVLATLRGAPPEAVRALIAQQLRRRAAQALGLPLDRLDEQAPLSRQGLDSLMAVGLKNQLREDLDIEVPLSALLQGGTLQDLSALLHERVTGLAAPAAAPAPAGRTADPWVITARPEPQARLRLLCFAFAGGGPAVFNQWPRWLSPEIEVCAVQLPGRGERQGEPPIQDLETLLAALEPAILPYLDRPYAMFGHCLGAIIMFELCRRLRGKAPPPLRIFASGAPAPRFYAVQDATAVSREKFHQMLRVIGFASTEALFKDEEAYRLLMPPVLADFALAARYRYRPGEPLGAPLTAFAAYEDSFAPLSVVEAWREVTTGPFSTAAYPGGHYFVESAREELLPEIRRWLLPTLSTPARDPSLSVPARAPVLSMPARVPSAPPPAPPIPSPRAGAEVSLVCFPSAGGEAALFSRWAAALPPRIELLPLELPGRGARAGEAPRVRVEQMVDSLLPRLSEIIDSGRRFAFFGHDLGGLLCFEAARRLRRAGRRLPSRLLLSAGFPPHMYYLPPLHLYPEARLVEMLGIFDFPLETLTPELLTRVRGDFDAAASYRYEAEAPLPVPVSVLIPEHDGFVPSSGMRQWGEHTSAGCSEHEYDGHHYSLYGDAAALLRIIAELI